MGSTKPTALNVSNLKVIKCGNLVSLDNKAVDKREVEDEDNLEVENLVEDEDEGGEESGLDVEEPKTTVEPFDPIINKGFCKLTFAPA